MTCKPEYAGYLIKKGRYFYRPDFSGYTICPLDAGRYTLKQAEDTKRCEPENFTIEPAPETLPHGVEMAIAAAYRRSYQ
jgi:hypothetical protein